MGSHLLYEGSKTHSEDYLQGAEAVLGERLRSGEQERGTLVLIAERCIAANRAAGTVYE